MTRHERRGGSNHDFSLASFPGYIAVSKMVAWERSYPFFGPRTCTRASSQANPDIRSWPGNELDWCISLVPRPFPAPVLIACSIKTVASFLVSEPDPRKIEKEGLVNRLGWKCTLRPVCRRTSDWLLISILMCVY